MTFRPTESKLQKEIDSSKKKSQLLLNFFLILPAGSLGYLRFNHLSSNQGAKTFSRKSWSNVQVSKTLLVSRALVREFKCRGDQ